MSKPNTAEMAGRFEHEHVTGELWETSAIEMLMNYLLAAGIDPTSIRSEEKNTAAAPTGLEALPA